MQKLSDMTVEFTGYYKDTKRLANKSEMTFKEAASFIRRRIQPTVGTITWTMQIKGDNKKSVENVSAALAYLVERSYKNNERTQDDV